MLWNMKDREEANKALDELAEETHKLGLCDFCQDTGYHLSPEVAEPIVIKCTNKNCKVDK